jgi:hypothetical protein
LIVGLCSRVWVLQVRDYFLGRQKRPYKFVWQKSSHISASTKRHKRKRKNSFYPDRPITARLSTKFVLLREDNFISTFGWISFVAMKLGSNSIEYNQTRGRIKFDFFLFSFIQSPPPPTPIVASAFLKKLNDATEWGVLSLMKSQQKNNKK